MITLASIPVMNTRGEKTEMDLLKEIRGKQIHLKHLYNRGSADDLTEYMKTEKELVELLKKYEQARGIPSFTIRKGTKVLYKR